MVKQQSEAVTDRDPMDDYVIAEVTTHITGRGGHYMWHRDHFTFTRLEFGELLIEPTEKFGSVESVLLGPGAWRADLQKREVKK